MKKERGAEMAYKTPVKKKSVRDSYLKWCRLCFLIVATWLCGCTVVVADKAPEIKIVGMLAGAGGLGDQSYNDMTFSGLGKAQKEFGFRLIVSETAEPTATARETAIQRLIDENADVIVASGTELIALVRLYSEKYPDIIFLINDCNLEGQHNVASTMFAHQEGSYLAGMLAASVSTSGFIGFIGGVDMPIIRTFLKGYDCGAKRVTPDIRIDYRFITAAPDYSGFSTPQQGLEAAEQMYGDGADVIYAVAGLTGNGVIQAARKHAKLVIGVDADQDHMAKGHVLTSMMKRLDKATYAEIAKIIHGEFRPGVAYYNLSNEGISLSSMKYTRHLIPDTVIQEIKQAQKDIIDGKVICW